MSRTRGRNRAGRGSRENVRLGDLPPDWRSTPAPPELAHFGDEFVDAGRTAILVVPSALAPSDTNWLLNPAYADFQQIAMKEAAAFVYDQRMVMSPKRRGR